MHILRVSDQQAEKAFIQFPARLYKNNVHWVRPLDQDIKDLFNPEKNSFFEHGEAERWILTNFRGTMIGRIAAFIDRDMTSEDQRPVGGIGFFECIDHPKAAFLLFDQCKEWLARHGVSIVKGPVNMLDRTARWGLLTDGFSEDPLYGMPYHYAYYQSFFEGYGFQLLNKQYNYVADLDEVNMDAAYKEKAQAVLNNSDYQISSVSEKDEASFAQNLMEVYNDAWQDHPDFLPVTLKQVHEIVQRLNAVIDKKMVLFAYYQHQPIGFFICLPELNQVYKHMNGRVNLFGRMKYLLNQEKEKKVIALMTGIKQAHQGKGVEAALVSCLMDYIKTSAIRYKYLEIAGVHDCNLKLIHIINKLHLKMSKVFHTYQYMIEQEEAPQAHVTHPDILPEEQKNLYNGKR